MYGDFQLRDLTFEISGKPFLNDSEEEMRRVARTLFRQWRRLAGRSGRISILLWIADGSEILEYTGNPADTFEWGYWQGIANPMPMPENPSPEAFRNYNFVPFRYREDAAPRTYGWLKRLIQILREVGTTECGGKPIRIGAAFDNGPEFSVSDFKYRRHREIVQAHSIYPNSFVTCDSVLHADPKPYAGFPEGIPEGTGIGTFLGRQYAALARDFGFDYLWLSNGMGFGTETWGVTGALFDQHAFYPEKIPEASARMLKFWRELLAELPGAVLETRGSNFPAGVEIATDAAPLGFLYGTGVIAPPVNSPMAAIDFNTGLAIASWMSHIAELPGRDYAFRYYIHDPWFLNSPWLDRYGCNPWDLYPVMTVSRMNGAGEVEPPSRLALLTCDDSYGGMPEQVPDEVIPHVIEAFSSTPDRSGPLLWVYPFAEYSRMRDLPRTFNEDMFIAAAIQDGLPLNTVISTGNFRRVAAKHPEKLTGTIPVVPVTALLEEDIAELLFSFAGRGNFILVYGSGAGIPERLAERIGFRRAAPQRGAARAELFLPGDRTSFSDRLFLHEQFSGGPAVEEALPETRIAAQARFAGGTRLLAGRNGSILFVRSLLPVEEEYLPENPTVFRKRHLNCAPPDRMFPSARLIRWSLAEAGWELRAVPSAPRQMPPRLCIARRDDAFLFCGYTPDTTVPLEIRTPLGVPVPPEQELLLKSGAGIWHTAKAFRFEVRVFVRQEAEGVISGKTMYPLLPGMTPPIEVRNLHNAEVRCLVPPGSSGWEVRRGRTHLPFEWEETPYGRCLLVRDISEQVSFSWKNQRKGNEA